MQKRRFGSTRRTVAIIGQGTWFIDEAERDEAIAALPSLPAVLDY